jgi:uncharacterized protein (TIGR03663 family)
VNPSPPSEPSAAGPASTRWRTFFWAAFAAALALRLAFPEARLMHHDEGINGWFVSRLLDGHGWAYDPAHYHGPFLFYAALPAARLLGESALALRLPVALASALSILFLLPLRRRLGGPGTAAAAWILALSPSLVFYGRDFIHETYLAALTLAGVAAVASWIDGRRDRDFLLAGLAFGLLATVKETWVLSVAALGAAGLAVLLRGASPPPLPKRRTLPLALAAFAVPYVLLYTSFLTNFRGLADSFRSYLLWLGKGVADSGHAKPWDYFPRLLLEFDPLAVAFAVAGGWLAWRRRDTFGTFCALWAGALLAAYSLIPYKTPWLGINIVLPAALAGGAVFRHTTRRRALVAVLACGLLWSGWRAVEVSLLRWDDPNLKLTYVETHREAEELIARVREAAALPGAREIAILGPPLWPLPWYFRDLPVLYGAEPPSEIRAGIILIDPSLESRLPDLRPGYRRSVHLLRRGRPLVLYRAERPR